MPWGDFARTKPQGPTRGRKLCGRIPGLGKSAFVKPGTSLASVSARACFGILQWNYKEIVANKLGDAR